MYDEGAWPLLRKALTAAMKENNGAGLLALSDSYYERDTNGKYANLMFANAAVNCLDLPPAFGSPDQVRDALPDFEKASPVFGEGFAWAALNCTYWPVAATGEPQRIEAKGAAPIVVVGTTRDPATPYRWAQALADQLASARLLTYEGDGHTAYGRGSDCIDSAINAYLVDGTPPADGKRCS
ncbi:alpha/beta hydrolase [Streptomyces hirsutus]